VRCSWSTRPRRATPRLALAVAASLALHGALIASLGSDEGSPAGWPVSVLTAILVPEAAAQQPAAPPRYYRTSELDVVPGIMTRVNPEYPQLARASGKVLIRLFIDERGVVERVAVLRAEPKGYFEASAQRAFLAARFTPGMKAGKAVKTQLTLQVDYQYPR
jgi:protein TonB